MIGAKLHGLRLASSTPALSGCSLAIRCRGLCSVAVRPALPTTRKSVVVASAKKFRGRRAPLPRFDLSELDQVEGKDDSGSVITPDPSARTSQSLPAGRDPSSSEPKLGTPAGRDPSSRKPKLGAPAGKPSPKQQSERVEGAPLRGLDVLLALKNAAAQKNSRRGKPRHAGTRSGGGSSEQGGDDGEVETRPLEIKEDWEPRLEELEKAVEEIQQQQLGDSM